MILLNWVHCPSCGSHDTVSGRSSTEPRQGTLLTVKIFCEFVKLPQTGLANHMSRGIQTVIICSGSSISKVIRLLKFMKVWGIQKSTFFEIIMKFYSNYQIVGKTARKSDWAITGKR